MAVLNTSSGIFDIFGAASYQTVTAFTALVSGDAPCTNIDNGLCFYGNQYSWGFTEEGNTIRQNSADLNLHPSLDNNKGLSFHANGLGSLNQLGSGWAYNNGAFTSIAFDQQRVWLTTNTTTVPEPSTLAILGLGLMGLVARRFKKQA